MLTTACHVNARKGWTAISAQHIPAGAFVCQYAGELITTADARQRLASYDLRGAAATTGHALLVRQLLESCTLPDHPSYHNPHVSMSRVHHHSFRGPPRHIANASFTFQQIPWLSRAISVTSHDLKTAGGEGVAAVSGGVPAHQHRRHAEGECCAVLQPQLRRRKLGASSRALLRVPHSPCGHVCSFAHPHRGGADVHVWPAS